MAYLPVRLHALPIALPISACCAPIRLPIAAIMAVFAGTVGGPVLRMSAVAAAVGLCMAIGLACCLAGSNGLLGVSSRVPLGKDSEGIQDRPVASATTARDKHAAVNQVDDMDKILSTKFLWQLP